jgi:hypothetical protein
MALFFGIERFPDFAPAVARVRPGTIDTAKRAQGYD